MGDPRADRDRTAEHLSYSDRGVVLYRRLLKENIEWVQPGLDPFALIRDPDHEMIDTNLMGSIEQQTAARAPAEARAQA